MKLLDWIGRTALLALSGLATMALLTSIASVSQDAFETATGQGPRASEVPDASTIEPPPLPSPPLPPVADPAPGERGVPVAADAAPPGDREIARWIEALTYAVLALAGFAAAALVVLLRITAHLARIADRS